MATTSWDDVAASFLRQAKAPDTPQNRAAIATWGRHESGSNIVGNNPWNIHYDTAVSYGITPSGKWWSNNDKAYVAMFATLDQGTAVTVAILDRPAHGYGAALAKLRAGDAVGFLNGIAASDWASGHYGAVVNTATHTITGGTNGLIATYNSIVGSGGTATAGNTLDKLLTLLGHGADVFGPGDTLNQSEIDHIRTTLYGDGTPLANGTNALTTAEKDALIAKLKVGMKLGDITLTPREWAALSADTGGFVGVGPTDPKTGAYVGPGSDVLDSLTGVLGYLTDPAHWLYIFALVIGVGMTGYGVIILVRGYAGGAIAIEAPKATTP